MCVKLRARIVFDVTLFFVSVWDFCETEAYMSLKTAKMFISV